ncbi:MAG: S41 family peptidase [Spirochaetia bacterium]
MSESANKKFSHHQFERTLWLSLTSILVLIIVLLSVFAFPNFWQQSQATVTPLSQQKETPHSYTQRIERIYKLILNKYLDEVEAKELYRAAIKGMVSLIDDPYAELLENSSATGVQDTIRGEFGGVGLVISKFNARENEQNSQKKNYQELYVVTPIEGTPAHRAGIRGGDYIVSIDTRLTSEISTEESMSLLRGKVGTTVSLSIRRSQTIFDVTLKRAKIEVETAKYSKINELGYLRMIQFTTRLPLRVNEAILALQENDMKGLIVDLRGNPGGSLDAVLEIGDYFLGKNETIVSTSSRDKSDEVHYKSHNDALFNTQIPIVVLVDKGTASAAEILAGALQSHKRATIIGEATYGKAKVQQIYPLKNDHSELFKLTVARYLTPSGKNIDGEGIIPDILVNSPFLTSQGAAKDWATLTKERAIESFLTQFPNPSPQQISHFISTQRNKYQLSLSNEDFQYLISTEKDRRSTPMPIYNLQYDPVLRKAIDILSVKDHL